MYKKTADGSIEDERGRVIFFSAERFEADICRGGCCFICGARPGAVEFNDEHILPEWLLRKFDLFKKQITLPNGALFRYDRYTIPCCVSCNSLLGTEIEDPISRVISGGYEAVRQFVARGGELMLFTWLGLIFFKMHLKDVKFRHHVDARQGADKIGDAYEWGLLHHLHTVIRHFYTGCEVAPEALGSLLIWPMHGGGLPLQFDYADNFISQSQFIGFGDFGIASVFDDSSAAVSCMWDRLQKIDAALSPLQAREVFVELGWLRLHLKDRTRFHTIWDQGTRCKIVAQRGSLDLLELDLSVRGAMLHHAISSAGVGLFLTDADVGADPDQLMKEGKTTVLFDAEGKFIRNSVVRPAPQDDAPE